MSYLKFDKDLRFWICNLRFESRFTISAFLIGVLTDDV